MRFNARAEAERANRRNAWMARPVQRIPAPVTTEAEIARESRQIYYGQLIHDGHDEQTAYELTVAKFAIDDHKRIGEMREEE